MLSTLSTEEIRQRLTVKLVNPAMTGLLPSVMLTLESLRLTASEATDSNSLWVGGAIADI